MRAFLASQVPQADCAPFHAGFHWGCTANHKQVSPSPCPLATGVVVAVRGVQRPGEDFQVTDLVFAGMPAQPPRPVVEVS